MALRDVVVRFLGESVARRIEQFVEGEFFGDELLPCPACATPVASAYICERGMCPVCGATAGQETVIIALEARRRAAQEAGAAAIREMEEIDRELSHLRQSPPRSES